MLIQRVHKIEIGHVSLPCLHLTHALSSHHFSEKKDTHFENINFI